MLPPTSARHSRASSIPRQYFRERTVKAERFSVSDAVHLKLRIQNLDNALTHADQNIDFDQIEEASRTRPFHETTSPYVSGSEEFFLVVKSFSRADLIPDVYLEAYRAVLNRRPYVNTFRVSDYKKGVDPIFSDILPILPSIDAICETDLGGAFRKLEAKVKPFPLLQLPAELRLQVYSYLLPRDNSLLLSTRMHRDRGPQRVRLDIMRANHQLRDEVAKYFYQNRSLCMSIARDKAKLNLSNEYISKYFIVLKSMNPFTRTLLRSCRIQIDYFSTQALSLDRTIGDTPAEDPMPRIFQLLPCLQALTVTFGPRPFASDAGATHRIVRQRLETVEWLIGSIPDHVDLKWDLSGALGARFNIDETPLRSLIGRRGSIIGDEASHDF